MAFVSAVNGSNRVHPVICAFHPSEAWQRILEAFSSEAGFLLFGAPPDIRELRPLAELLTPAVLLAEGSALNDHSAEVENLVRSARVLILAVVDQDGLEERYLRMGCMGILRRDAGPTSYARAIRAAIEGEIWAPRKLLTKLLREFLSLDFLGQLTARELSILDLISAGDSNREIAEKLFLSRETVRWHVRNLYAKLGIADRQDARNLMFQLRSSGWPTNSDSH